MRHNISRPLLAVCLVATGTLISLPATLFGSGAPHPEVWTIDDLVKAEAASHWRLSADGELAVWLKESVESVEDREERVANLWLTRMSSGESWQLTRGTDSVSHPRLSPDDRYVAFLTDRRLPDRDPESDEQEDFGETQLWVIPLVGGEAFPVTRWSSDVELFGWIDGERLLFAAAESASWWRRGRHDLGDTSRVVDDYDHQPPVRLYRVTVSGGELDRLTLNDDWIDQLAVSPDGRWAVVAAQQSLSYEFDQKVPPETRLIELASGQTQPLFADGRLLPHDMIWSPDSDGFYFLNEYTRHPLYREATISELWFFDVRSGAVERVEHGHSRGVGGGYAVMRDGLVALMADGVRYRALRIDRVDGGEWRTQQLDGKHVANLNELAVVANGSALVYEYTTASLPPQWYVAELEGSRLAEERRLTRLNPGHEGKPTGRVEVIRWTGALGDEVEGLLHYPLDWEPDQRYPLVLDIHGGPTGVDRDRWDQTWSNPFILWRQQGAFVLQANYHGSGGYGLDWVESIGEGKYYELEVPDLEAGVDEVIRRGLVDPTRLAASGWSNGGILAAALITHTPRYRAAIVGAADVEWFSDWGNVDFGAAFDNYYFGGTPWEIPHIYLEKSPFFRLTEVRTPTLVHTGTEDRNVPPSQSWSLFRALQYLEQTPARLVLYPGEPHSLQKVAHQRRKIEEDVAWLEQHLFGRPIDAHPIVREGSLLAGLLARHQAMKHGPAYGVEVDGVLEPEMTSMMGLSVGQFEVTRAQYAAFDAALRVRPGQENMPVTGIGFDRARAYADWLGERWHRPVRLPTRQEAERLAETAGDGGNTLDLWAGYTPNPGDVGRIHRALQRLDGASLLLPVGSRAPVEETGVFDLDGNAAEWAVDEEGGGIAVGPSADRSTDRASDARPSPAYIGFRVVVAAAPAAGAED